MKQRKIWLDEMTWEEAAKAFEETDIAVICCGATHEKGPACPLGTDTFIAKALGERIGKKSNVIVVPPIPFGYALHHMDFPGNIHISSQHLGDFYMDICESLYKWGIRKLVWINCHGGNRPNVEDVAYRLRYEKGMLSAFVNHGVAQQLNPDLAGYGSEGLVDEISIMLYIRPDTVNPEKVVFKKFKNTLGPEIQVVGFKRGKFGKAEIDVYTTTKEISDSGQFPWPSLASAPKSLDVSKISRGFGEDIIETAANYIIEFIKAFRKVKTPPPNVP